MWCESLLAVECGAGSFSSAVFVLGGGPEHFAEIFVVVGDDQQTVFCESVVHESGVDGD